MYWVASNPYYSILKLDIMGRGLYFIVGPCDLKNVQAIEIPGGLFTPILGGLFLCVRGGYRHNTSFNLSASLIPSHKPT